MHVLAFWGGFLLMLLPFFKCVALQEHCTRLLAAPDPAATKFGPDESLWEGVGAEYQATNEKGDKAGIAP